MLNKKEKNVKNYLLDENIEFSNEDKDIVLNKIKSKINLEVEEKPSFKQKFNLKVVYALVCSLVICVVGFIGVRVLNNNFINPNYRGKDVESLNLNDEDFCLAYNLEVKYEQFDYLKQKYAFKFDYKSRTNAYILSLDRRLLFVFGEYKNSENCEIYLCKSSLEIIEIYNNTYNTTFDEENLNDNNSGLLFGIVESGVEFYTIKNGINYSIFVEFA